MEEAPERKKLKSTYKPSPNLLNPLPPGWTEHTAPSGHKYYYNSQSKKSTYTRPVADALPAPVPIAPLPAYNPAIPQSYNPAARQSSNPSAQTDYAALAQSYSNGNIHQGPTPYTVPPVHYQQHHFDRRPFNNHRRPQPEDRPKKKAIIPACAPWILVYTKLGRRFVHNTDTNESLWKFPPDVMTAVIEFDKLELEKKLAAKDTKDEGTGANNVPVGQNNRQGRTRRSESLQREDEAALAARASADRDEAEDDKVVPINPQSTADIDADDSSEYEEIEVTDDENEDTQPNPQEDTSAPVEFGEDDIAYQLAQMGADYGLDPGEYDDDDNTTLEPGAEGLPLTEADATALFHDLLDDFNPSPFTPYDALLEDEHGIISDDRYTILPTTRARQAAHASWSRSRIASLKLARSQMEQQDPRIPYLAFLAANASPKLYWPEFKRKFKKDDCMRDRTRPVSFLDKDREKLYREHISRLKLPSSTRKEDLRALLAAQPLSKLNRNTDVVEGLPKEVLRDVRYISLPVGERDALVKAWVTTLKPAPTDLAGEEENEEERAEREKKRRERERREEAMRERERRVDEEKRRVERDLRVGKARLRENEREVEEASRVGREGLRAQIGGLEAGDDTPTQE